MSLDIALIWRTCGANRRPGCVQSILTAAPVCAFAGAIPLPHRCQECCLMPVSPSPTLKLFANLLRCPTCGEHPLQLAHGSLRCPAGHTFNIARHGYLGLL